METDNTSATPFINQGLSKITKPIVTEEDDEEEEESKEHARPPRMLKEAEERCFGDQQSMTESFTMNEDMDEDMMEAAAAGE